MIDELLIPARYCGPPRSANGGYTAGALAHALAGTEATAVSVRLSQPPPLDTAMQVERTPEGVSLTSGGSVVASAAPVDHEFEPVEPVPHEEAEDARASYAGLADHPFPTCFSCGTGREDGLRIFPGAVAPVDGRRRVAAGWTPEGSIRADWHEAEGPDIRACSAATWAALDCIGAWSGDFGDGRPQVLGTMTARLDTLPVIGEPHVVMGQLVSQEGRRTMTASTLYDSDGRIVGLAEHTWVTIDPATFGGSS